MKIINVVCFLIYNQENFNYKFQLLLYFLSICFSKIRNFIFPLTQNSQLSIEKLISAVKQKKVDCRSNLNCMNKSFSFKQYSLTWSQFSIHYKLIKHYNQISNQSMFGQFSHYLHLPTKKRIFVKEFNFENQQEMRYILTQIEQTIKYNRIKPLSKLLKYCIKYANYTGTLANSRRKKQYQKSGSKQKQKSRSKQKQMSKQKQKQKQKRGQIFVLHQNQKNLKEHLTHLLVLPSQKQRKSNINFSPGQKSKSGLSPSKYISSTHQQISYFQESTLSKILISGYNFINFLKNENIQSIKTIVYQMIQISDLNQVEEEVLMFFYPWNEQDIISMVKQNSIDIEDSFISQNILKQLNQLQSEYRRPQCNNQPLNNSSLIQHSLKYQKWTPNQSYQSNLSRLFSNITLHQHENSKKYQTNQNNLNNQNNQYSNQNNQNYQYNQSNQSNQYNQYNHLGNQNIPSPTFNFSKLKDSFFNNQLQTKNNKLYFSLCQSLALLIFKLMILKLGKQKYLGSRLYKMNYSYQLIINYDEIRQMFLQLKQQCQYSRHFIQIIQKLIFQCNYIKNFKQIAEIITQFIQLQKSKSKSKSKSKQSLNHSKSQSQTKPITISINLTPFKRKIKFQNNQKLNNSRNQRNLRTLSNHRNQKNSLFNKNINNNSQSNSLNNSFNHSFNHTINNSNNNSIFNQTQVIRDKKIILKQKKKQLILAPRKSKPKQKYVTLFGSKSSILEKSIEKKKPSTTIILNHQTSKKKAHLIQQNLNLSQSNSNLSKSNSKLSKHQEHLVNQIKKKMLYDKNGKLYSNIIEKKFRDGSIYLGQYNPQSNTKEGNGLYFYHEGDIYGGTWKNDQLNGLGVYIFINGDSYQGQVINGEKQGFGTYHYSNGNYYQGLWKQDKKSGKGKYRYANGDFYEGAFKEGKKQGKGIYRWENGDIYQGDFVNNLKQGKGAFKAYNKQQILEGTWQNDQFFQKQQFKSRYQHSIKTHEGQSKYSDEVNKKSNFVINNSAANEGSIKKSIYEGDCQIMYPNGDIYKGHMKNDLFQGFGEYYFAEKKFKYIGQWHEGLQHGQGRIIYQTDGTTIHTMWEKGKYSTNKGIISYSNKERYQGQINERGRHGRGKYYFANQKSIQGQFQNNKLVHTYGTAPLQ